MQIPDTAVANRCGKAVVKRYTPRHKGRAPSIREDCYSVLVDIDSFEEIIHDVSDGRFQIGTAHHLLEPGAGACS